jgi:hypothetical protein
MNENTFAFPHEITHLHKPLTAGMTLRDYFASKAMPLSYKYWNEDYFDSRHPDFEERSEESKDFSESMMELIAIWSYEMADAMMKAREANDARAD